MGGADLGAVLSRQRKLGLLLAVCFLTVLRSNSAVIARSEATHPRVASLALRAIHLLAIRSPAVGECVFAGSISVIPLRSASILSQPDG